MPTDGRLLWADRLLTYGKPHGSLLTAATQYVGLIKQHVAKILISKYVMTCLACHRRDE